jgi:MFS family permease
MRGGGRGNQAGPSALEWVVSGYALTFGLGLVPLGRAINATIQRTFSCRDRSRALGYLSSTVGISTATGPLLGGALIEMAGPHDGWRWVFLINLFIGAAAGPAAAKMLPHRHEPEPHGLAGLDRRGGEPVIRLDLLRHMGRSALDTGLLVVPFALGSLLGAANRARFSARFGRNAILAGAGVMFAGQALVLLVPADWRRDRDRRDRDRSDRDRALPRV